MANDELYTPKFIFDELKLIFDLDVCAPEGGSLHTPAVEYFDKHSDGLTAKWFGLVWMNPPYSKPSPWVDKWLEHNNGVALLPVSKSNWYLKLWNSEATGCMLPINMTFVNQQGLSKRIYMPTFVWAIGDVAQTALRRCSWSNVR